MPNSQAHLSNTRQASGPVSEPAQLAAVVRAMSQEIERLHEDNLQLRAAILMYREVVRRYTRKTG